MFCSECGFKLAISAKFCSGCGHAVQRIESPQQSAQTQPPTPTHAQPPRQVEPDFIPPVQQAAFTPQPAPLSPQQTPAAPHPATFASPSTASIAQPAKIVIEMESQPFLIKLGKIQVLLDDQVISSDLWFGKTMEFTLTEPGAHTIQIALKSVLTRSSEKLSFQIAPGQVIKFDGVYGNFGGGVSLVQI